MQQEQQPQQQPRIVQVRQQVLKKNDVLARSLRRRYAAAGVFVVSLVSSPGAGKTMLLRETLRRLRVERGRRVAALVGDLATANDAQRLAESGSPVRQIVTGTVCPLEAEMVERAIDGWELASLDFLFIENVGNLVCPASYDLGENLRVVLLSTTEGEDKPLKYPAIFNTADAAVITKIDLAAAVEFDAAAARRSIERVRPGMKILESSAKSAAGLEQWLDYLEAKRSDNTAGTEEVKACTVRSSCGAEAPMAAGETRHLQIGGGAVAAVPSVLRDHFGSRAAAVIADVATLRAAGHSVLAAIRAAGQEVVEPLVYEPADLYAEDRHVQRLQEWLGRHPNAVPIAVGAGTINDMTKLAAHRAGRTYMAVATAASMDGYTAFGASIVHRGSKQMFDCPAPRAVLADLDVMTAAPAPLNAAGYGDLLAKITAGADWILADALGEEPIDPVAWRLVQSRLKMSLSDPEGIRRGSMAAIRDLIDGLMMCGGAMQQARSSRPASGAEHHFSHLWDMEHHRHDGQIPFHGFKVAIGTLTIASAYEYLLSLPLEQLDVEAACRRWPDEREAAKRIGELFQKGEVAEKARQEWSAKYVSRESLRRQLIRLRAIWPDLAARLREQLIPVERLRQMLSAAGAPTEGEQIGITRERLCLTFRQARFIRRRFTVLDLLERAGLTEGCIAHLFSGCAAVDRAHSSGDRLELA